MNTCLYRYDPLDRLAHTAQEQGPRRYFYLAQRRVSELAADRQLSFLHTGQQGLAVHERSAAGTNSTLIAPDRQDSVLVGLSSRQRLDLSYCPYGHQDKASGLPGFNGEFPEGPTGHYLLGNGYRAFNPVLMHFNSPDSLSPFGAGGLNAYAYCAGDPLNFSDGSGHMFNQIRPLVDTNRASNAGRPMLTLRQMTIRVLADRDANDLLPLPPKLKEEVIAAGGSKSRVLEFYSKNKDINYNKLEVMQYKKESIYERPALRDVFENLFDQIAFYEFIEHAKKQVGGYSPVNDIRYLGGGDDRMGGGRPRNPGNASDIMAFRISMHFNAIRAGTRRGILPADS